MKVYLLIEQVEIENEKAVDQSITVFRKRNDAILQHDTVADTYCDVFKANKQSVYDLNERRMVHIKTVVEGTTCANRKIKITLTVTDKLVFVFR